MTAWCRGLQLLPGSQLPFRFVACAQSCVRVQGGGMVGRRNPPRGSALCMGVGERRDSPGRLLVWVPSPGRSLLAMTRGALFLSAPYGAGLTGVALVLFFCHGAAFRPLFDRPSCPGGLLPLPLDLALRPAPALLRPSLSASSFCRFLLNLNELL